MREQCILRGLGVIRSDDEGRVGAETGSFLRQMDRFRGIGRTRPGDDGGAITYLFDDRAEEGQLLLVTGVGDSPVVPASTTPSEPLSTRCVASLRAPSTFSEPSVANGVSIAVMT